MSTDIHWLDSVSAQITRDAGVCGGCHDHTVATVGPVVVVALLDGTPHVYSHDERAAIESALEAAVNALTGRPDEPTASAAVIEDSRGDLWARTSWATWRCLTQTDLEPKTWDDFATVTVRWAGAND